MCIRDRERLQNLHYQLQTYTQSLCNHFKASDTITEEISNRLTNLWNQVAEIELRPESSGSPMRELINYIQMALATIEEATLSRENSCRL